MLPYVLIITLESLPRVSPKWMNFANISMHVLWPAAAPAARPWPRFFVMVPVRPDLKNVSKSKCAKWILPRMTYRVMKVCWKLPVVSQQRVKSAPTVSWVIVVSPTRDTRDQKTRSQVCKTCWTSICTTCWIQIMIWRKSAEQLNGLRKMRKCVHEDSTRP